MKTKKILRKKIRGGGKDFYGKEFIAFPREELIIEEKKLIKAKKDEAELRESLKEAKEAGIINDEDEDRNEYAEDLFSATRYKNEIEERIKLLKTKIEEYPTGGTKRQRTKKQTKKSRKNRVNRRLRKTKKIYKKGGSIIPEDTPEEKEIAKNRAEDKRNRVLEEGLNRELDIKNKTRFKEIVKENPNLSLIEINKILKQDILNYYDVKYPPQERSQHNSYDTKTTKNIIDETGVRYTKIYYDSDSDSDSYEDLFDDKYRVMKRTKLVWPEENLNDEKEEPVFSFYGSTPEEIEEKMKKENEESEEYNKKMEKRGNQPVVYDIASSEEGEATGGRKSRKRKEKKTKRKEKKTKKKKDKA
jgi:hypothetical protein